MIDSFRPRNRLDTCSTSQQKNHLVLLATQPFRACHRAEPFHKLHGDRVSDDDIGLSVQIDCSGWKGTQSWLPVVLLSCFAYGISRYGISRHAHIAAGPIKTGTNPRATESGATRMHVATYHITALMRLVLGRKRCCRCWIRRTDGGHCAQRAIHRGLLLVLLPRAICRLHRCPRRTTTCEPVPTKPAMQLHCNGDDAKGCAAHDRPVGHAECHVALRHAMGVTMVL